MAEQLVQEWLEANHAEDRLVEEERVVTELSGSEQVSDTLAEPLLMVEALDLGTITFPEFIRSITSRVENEPDLTIAGRGLSLLPRIFAVMQVEPTRNDVHALIPYLCARLEDASPGVYSISESLRIISKWKRFPPGDAQLVARAVFKLGGSNNFSSQTANTRLSLYELAQILQNTHPNALKRDMTIKEFIKGVVTMAELEKNPSCLRALFKLYAELSQQWTLDEDGAKMVFDSYIRYFPVTMKDAPRDPAIPSTAELRDLLTECFVSSDGYAKMTFDAMIDRLDVDSANTKVEVFKTLEMAAKSYSSAAVSRSGSKLWDTLKFEIWNGDNEDWISSSLSLLKVVTASLDRVPCDWFEKDNFVHPFVVGALSESKGRITDKPNTYLLSSGRIFNAIGSASSYSFYLVSKFAVPILDTFIQGHVSGPEKDTALEALNGILRARLQQVDVKPLPDAEFAEISPGMQEYHYQGDSHMSNAFCTFRDRLVEIYHEDVSQLLRKADMEQASGIGSIKGLVLLFGIPSYLSETEKGTMARDLVEVALKTGQNTDVREESLSALAQISAQQPSLFNSVVLAAILAKLPNKISEDRTEKKQDIAIAVSLLEALVRIGAIPGSTFINRQVNFVATQEKLVQKFIDTTQYTGQTPLQYALLASISAWFEAARSDDENVRPTSPNFQTLVEDGQQFVPILSLFQKLFQIESYLGVDRVRVMAGAGETLMRLVGEYAMRVLRDESTTPTNNFLLQWDRGHPGYPSAVWTLFTNMNRTDFDHQQAALEIAPNNQWMANTVSMYMIAGIRRDDIALLNEKFEVVHTAKAMLKNALAPFTIASTPSRLAILHFLQLLVNKFGAAKGPGKVVVDILRLAVEHAPSKEKEEALNTYQILAYFATAALAALDPSTSVLIQLMLDGINNPTYGQKIAQSFRLLLAPSNILTRENCCYIRPLRKGRLYELAVKPLIATWRSSQDPTVKQNALVALAGILAFLEPTMLADNARDLFPVLLEGTNLPTPTTDDFSRRACLKGILNLVPLAPSVVSEHLNSVIDAMTASPADGSVRCRALALDVLLSLTEHVEPAALLRRKAALVRELDAALEDVSSEVRHRAERCKMAWFNLVDGE